MQFRSYAQFRIRGAILDSLRTLDWSPRELRRKGRAVEEAIRVLTARLGRAPGEAEIAAEMGIEPRGVSAAAGRSEGPGDRHAAYGAQRGFGRRGAGLCPGRPEEDPLFRCLRGELEERLTEAIANLPDRERLVMTLYYYEEMTMREIGLALGVVESRVSQVHASAVVHLRAALRDLAVARRSSRPAGRIRASLKRSKFGAAERGPRRGGQKGLDGGQQIDRKDAQAG